MLQLTVLVTNEVWKAAPSKEKFYGVGIGDFGVGS